MKKIITYTILCLTLSGFCGCSGLLDEFPDSGIAQKEAMKDVQDMEKALVGIYSATKGGGLFSGDATLLPDLQSDFMYSVIGYSNRGGEFYQWASHAQSGGISNVWGSWWNLISRVNFLLENIDKVTPTAAQKERYNHIIGEASLARALAYSEMIKLYSDPYGMNLDGSPADPEKQLALPIWDKFETGTPARTNMVAYYQHILDDIAVAKKNITTGGTDNIYFTKGAVRALEARVYLAMGKWDKSIQASSYLIDSCQYKLAEATKTQNQEISEYGNMWLSDIGSEIIWKISYRKDDLGGALGYQFYYSTNGKFSPDYVPAQWVLNLYSQNDARYNIFFKEEATAYTHKLKWPLLKKYPGNPALRTGANSNYVNMPKVFRLSEIYLIRAEAYLESGNEAMAMADVKALQSKRMSSVPSITDVRQEIRNERVRELYMEGHRLYDLKRWGQGFKRTPQISTVPIMNALKIERDNVLFTWPIPSHEINVPGSKMVGNPSNNR